MYWRWVLRVQGRPSAMRLWPLVVSTRSKMLWMNGYNCSKGPLYSNSILKYIETCTTATRLPRDTEEPTPLAKVHATVQSTTPSAPPGLVGTTALVGAAETGAPVGDWMAKGGLVAVGVGLAEGARVGVRVGPATKLVGARVGATEVAEPMNWMLRMVPQALGWYSFIAGFKKSTLGLERYK